MARAKRHYIPGQIWYLSLRCHKREFFLKFLKDRHRRFQWFYEARKQCDFDDFELYGHIEPYSLTRNGRWDTRCKGLGKK